MKETVLQRVNYVIDNFGKTKNHFANEIGMSGTTVWRQLKGEQALSSKLIEGILTAYPDVSAEWLLRGTGDIRLGNCKNIAETQKEVSVPILDESVWKTRYETMKECYDSLVANIGGFMGKRNVG